MSQPDIPVLDHGVIGNGRVLALISPTTSIDWLCLARFDSPSVFAARQRPTPVHVTGGLEIADGLSRLYLRTNVPVPYLESGQPIRIDQPYYFVLSYGKPSDIDSVASVQRALDLTIAGWRAWVKTCARPSFADTHVLRSALCLKLHAFADTGAIIAITIGELLEARDARFWAWT